MSIKIYYNPGCQKCRDALNAICETGSKPEIIEYLNDTPTFSELKKIIIKLKIKPFELIRQKEEIFQSHFLGKNLSGDEWIKAMVKFPILIQRPIIINDDKAVIGRTDEKLQEILKIKHKKNNTKKTLTMKTVKFITGFILMISSHVLFAQNSAPATFTTQMQTVLTDYLQLKSALIHQDVKKINTTSGDLLAASKAVKPTGLTADDLKEWNKYSSPVQAGTQDINTSTDVVKQLASFSDVSVSLYNLVKYFKISTQKLYYDYCPMANDGQGAYWVSNTKEIVNPYYKGVNMGCELQKDSF